MSLTINYNWKYPKIFEPLFSYSGRYIALTGGRSSGKSWVVAHYLLEKLIYQRKDCLCCREHQNSIQESNYKLFVNIIRKYNLPYDVQSTKIISKITGSRLVFVGLSDVTADNIKSFEDFDLVWIEEAQKISKKSWEILNPTIRKENAQIYITMNPEVDHIKHPIMSELLTLFKDETLHIHANYYDNPFCSKDIIKIAELTKVHKPDEYKHVWLGIPRDENQNNVVKCFTQDNVAPITYQPDMPLHLTWDFNVDPMSCICAHKTAKAVYYFDEFILENASTDDSIDFENLSQQSKHLLRKQWKQFAKNNFIGKDINIPQYPTARFSSKNLGKEYLHNLPRYEGLQNNLPNSQYRFTTNFNKEKDRLYDHLIDNNSDGLFDYLMEVIQDKNGNISHKYKMMKDIIRGDKP